MFIKSSIVKRKLRGLAIYIFMYIENNGNCRFDKNGEKVFVDNLMRFFHSKNGKKIVFDIGANIGEYSQMIKDKSDKIDVKVHLFEPTKSCFDVVSKKFGKEKDVVLNNFGVSDSNATAMIYYDKEESGLASLYQRNLNNYNLKLDKSEKIVLRRLDEYIEEKKIHHVDFVKIDIEGHELKALEGFGDFLNNKFIDYIQFEYGGANLDSHTSLMEMYKFFKNKGFSIAKIMPNGLDIREYSPFMENFSYSNYVAISNNVLPK